MPALRSTGNSPYYQPLLIAHSVTAEPGAWGGEGTGEQELSSNPKPQPEIFLGGTSEPVL